MLWFGLIETFYRVRKLGSASAKAVRGQVLEIGATGTGPVERKYSFLCGVLGWRSANLQRKWELFEVVQFTLNGE